MPFLRTDDSFTDDRRVRRLSDAAYRLHSHALHYCARIMTDGLVDDDVVHGLTRHMDAEQLADELVGAGLWEHRDDGFYLPQFLEWNKDRERSLQDRQSAKERQQRWLDKKRDASRDGVRDGVRDGALPNPPRPVGIGEGKGDEVPRCGRGHPLAKDGTCTTPDCPKDV